MTDERKDEQKPWYPRIERMPEIRDVATWQNGDIDDEQVLLEDAEVEENAPVADNPRGRETAASRQTERHDDGDASETEERA